MRQLPAMARIGATAMICILAISCSGSDATSTPTLESIAVDSQPQNTLVLTTPTAVTTSTTQTPNSPLALGGLVSHGSTTTYPSPTPLSERQVFHGENAYGPDYPTWEVSYDPADWRLEGALEHRDQTLAHNEIQGCRTRLNAGPLGAMNLAEKTLANRTWNINRVRGCNLHYFTPWEGGGFFFGIRFAEDCELDQIIACLVEAEEVIDTFSMVGE